MILIFIRSVEGSSIRNATITDERDSEFVQELQSLGVNRNVALVITFLKDQNERYFKDIEIAIAREFPYPKISDTGSNIYSKTPNYFGQAPYSL